MFRNREDAASRLADRLEAYAGERPVVLGIPRGGMPMAAIVADRLGADLDVMLVHKLRAPFQPELAVGSVDEAGHVYLTRFAHELGLDAGALAAETEQQLATLRRRRERYTSAHPRVALTGRTVILVDDGLATGATAIAAIRAARAEGASRVVIAVGVAPPDMLARLRQDADDVVCIHTPDRFSAVGEFFADFSEVTDDEVVRILTSIRAHAAPHAHRERPSPPAAGSSRMSRGREQG